MPLTSDQLADLSARRGKASARITDPAKKQRFISAQGDVEDRRRRKKINDQEADAEYAKLGREADDTEATAGMNIDMNVPSYAKGIKCVPKTGLAKLHRGEKVVPAKKNKKFIQSAIKHPGALRKAAAKAGQSTRQFAQSHKHDSGKVGQRSRLAITLMKMH